MAQRVETILIDDLDGSNAAETIAFTVDGVSYEIDLNEDNAAELREDFTRWIENARRTGGKKQRGGRPSSGRSEQMREIRNWARSQGYDVPTRGRVPGNLVEAYENAH